MSCDSNKLFISLYFFQNGSCYKPERVRVRMNEIGKTIQKEGKFCYFRGKCIYTMSGECINSLCKLTDNSAYVLVIPLDLFKPLNYSQAFNDLKQKTTSRRMDVDHNRSCQNKSSCHYRKCQSTPAIPITCRNSSEKCVKFVPCEEEESTDDECPYEPMPSDKCQKSSLRKKKKKKEQKPPAVVKKKKGFWCCVTAQPSMTCPSKPMIECENGKMTQTTVEDFKCAVARMRRATKDEKKRQKVYNRKATRKEDPRCDYDIKPSYCPPDSDGTECEDPKKLKNLERARKKYYQKRIEMSKKVSKSLDRKYGKELKKGEC